MIPTIIAVILVLIGIRLKVWRSQIICWSLSVMFLVLAVVWLYVFREPNKGLTEVERHILQVAGVVFAFVAVLFFILALRAKKLRHNDVV
jgi:cbb3-type cytochrome oxidase subunit 3